MRHFYRSRQRQGGSLWGGTPPSLSLFPFLAVLISTMGILILLIVVMVRQSRKVASEVAAARLERIEKDLKADLELLDWQMEVIRQAVEVGQEKIQSLRDILGHLEDHTRRLIDRRRGLLNILGEREQSLPGGASADKIREELARLEERIQIARAEIEELSRQSGRKRRYYSIVPYGGPFGSTRQPIYLECRQDAIVLQPEGITFVPQDFEGELGPGNPLDTAIRAIREYHVRSGLGGAKPYPLFVVRPGGISAYYIARAALEPWGGEFGYELVEEDWHILYPAPNPHLAKEVLAAVELARARIRALAQISSRRWASAPRRFVVSPDGGGLVAEDGKAFRGNFLATPRGLESGENTLNRWNRPPEPPRPTGEDGIRLSGGGAQGQKSFIPNDPIPRAQPWGSELRAGKGGANIQEIPGNPQFSSQLGPASGVDHRVAGEIGWPQGESFITGPASEGSRNALQPGEPLLGQRSDVEGSGMSSQSLATVRGPNWALPPGSGVLVPIWRPVRILCTPEYVILEPEEGLGEPVVIPWQEPVENTVDELVRSVWEYVERWGPAGRGMGWRPQLKVRVAPGGEARCKVLFELLHGSGLSLELVN